MGDGCPRCGGQVTSMGASFLQDGGTSAELWVEHGSCESCGARMQRPIGPASEPVASMRPLDGWRTEGGDQ